MNMHATSRGFTIIEVMLVLAVTGLMLVGVFVGANAQINTQRYKDSVTGLQAELRSQFDQTLNVTNDRSNKGCPIAEGSTPTSRGADQSCLMLGRLIHGNDTKITSMPVVGTVHPNGEIANLGGIDESKEEYQLTWGSNFKSKTSTGAYSDTFSALILTSPSNGVVETYIDNANGTKNAKDLYDTVADTKGKELTLCVANGSDAIAGGQLAVRISKAASGVAGVEIPRQVDTNCGAS